MIKNILEDIKDIAYEIIFVNDGPTDNSKEELEKIKDDRVKIICLEGRRRKYFALFTRIKNAANEVIAINN